SEKFTLIPSEPSITVHSPSSKLRSPCTTKGSASAISRAASALAARTMVSPSPRILPSASANGPEAKQHALLLQTDHVFEVARQMLGDRFGRRPTLGEDDVELFTKHGLGGLADPLLRHRVLPFAPAAYCTPLSPCTAASMARRPAAIKDRARGPTHSGAPAFSCKQQEKNRRPGTTGAGGLPVSSRKTTGNPRNLRRVGGRGLPSITGLSRTKTGNRRNPDLQDQDGRARIELRLVAEPFTVIPSHDVKQPTNRPAADRGAEHAFTSPRYSCLCTARSSAWIGAS